MKIFQVIFALMMLLNINANAQCKQIKLAVKAMNNSDIDSSMASLKLAEAIIKENGLETVNEKCMAKYYYTKAALHLLIGQKEDSVSSKISYFDISKSNYELYLKTNKVGDLHDMVMSNLLSLSIEYSNVGVEYYQVKNFSKALEYMEKGISLKRMYHPEKAKPIDLFNAMVCAKMVKQFDLALNYADSLLANKKITRDGRIKYLGQKVEILTITDKSEEALVVLDTLKILDPNDPDLKLAELQIYLNKDMNTEAIALLNDITKKVKNREDLWVIKGQLHYQQSEIDSSVMAFSNALILNKKSYSALYGLGVIYVNRGNVSIQNMNKSNGKEKLAFEENVKIDFGVAIGYLMKILEFKTEDLNSLNALKMIYNSLSDEHNENLIDKRIYKIKNPISE
ncbi:MAG: tetratricopeptide (TPR) repeat protein [Saprospiraceae bacterium]|jgi:tetratricopeptide (TPR) repeat protein